MPASYPSSIVTLATHNDGDTIFSADINNPNAEIVAIETGLLNGIQHNVIPLTDDTYSLGSSSKRWLKSWMQDLDADGATTLGGLLDVSAAAAGQVKFPVTQNASANPQTLDDYQEGTWTPTDASGASLSLTLHDATYAKIGSLVLARAYVTYPSTASGSSAAIGGLPFTVLNLGAAPISSGASIPIVGQMAAGGTTVGLFTNGTAVTNSQVSLQNVVVSAVYRV